MSGLYADPAQVDRLRGDLASAAESREDLSIYHAIGAIESALTTGRTFNGDAAAVEDALTVIKIWREVRKD